jgi:hypothetical protein
MDALYRETTPEMLARVTAGMDERLSLALATAAPLVHEVDELGRKRLPRGSQEGRRRPSDLRLLTVEPSAGIEPATPSLPWDRSGALC